MSSTTTVELICKKEGFTRRTIVDEFIGEQPAVLRNTSQNLPVSINCIGRIDKKYPYHIHAQAKGKNILIFSRLNKLPLNTWWRPYGKMDRCFPCWQQVNTTDFAASYLWTPPENMGLWLICMYQSPLVDARLPEHDERTMTAAILEKVYLVAVKTNAAGLWKLPLCNIYGDAGVCMGNNHNFDTEAKGRPNVVDRYLAALAHFKISPWNAHMAPDIREENTQALFTMSINGDKNVDTPDDWQKNCVKVNNTFYGDLNLINLTKANL